MNYPETLHYLLGKLPMYQRIGSPALKKDLTNTLALCKLCGNPETKVPVVHVAGTNGKGSVSNMLASVLQMHGFKTGLYTSPHLTDFRERIRINGEKIPETEVIRFVEEYREGIESIGPSFFEATAVMAFHHFASQDANIAIIETGLGGRLDSTNVVNPELSVITNISLEHQNFLGDTLRQIAGEKAGIIKPGKPIVIGRKQPETAPVFIEKAAEVNAPLTFSDDTFQVNIADEVSGYFEAYNKISGNRLLINPDLSGMYQQENLQTSLCALSKLSETFPSFVLNEELLLAGLENVVKQTGLCGRWQILRNMPLIVCDIAHNAEGLQKVFQQIKKINPRRLHVVYGSVKDKDLASIMPYMPDDATYYLCSPKIERGLPVDELQVFFAGYNNVSCFATAQDALTDAIESSDDQAMILITGSAFLVAEILEHYNETSPLKE